MADADTLGLNKRVSAVLRHVTEDRVPGKLAMPSADTSIRKRH